MVDQICAIDNRRLREYVGRLSAHPMADLMTALQSILDMS